jgi:uncharacterized protein (DUF1810 family)
MDQLAQLLLSAGRFEAVAGEDPHALERFVTAQDRGVYPTALAELRAGRKRGHWMWFVFPQIAGLGSSPTARHYAIGSLVQARAYLAHPVLGPRLRESAQALVGLDGTAGAEDILGSIDALKLRSSMTLFARAAPEETLFARVLERYYDGAPDPATDARVGG